MYGRRSVRKFKDEKISDEVLTEIVDAALWAPSGVNLQPWYYVIVRSDSEMERLKGIMAVVSEKVRKHLEIRYAANPEVASDTASFIASLGNAQAAVLAFRDKPDYSWALQDEGIVQSIGASMENLILCAYDHGVSSCWLTAAPQADMAGDMRDEFAPGHGELVCMAVLGYAEAEDIPKAPKRKPGKFELI